MRRSRWELPKGVLLQHKTHSLGRAESKGHDSGNACWLNDMEGQGFNIGAATDIGFGRLEVEAEPDRQVMNRR